MNVSQQNDTPKKKRLKRPYFILLLLLLFSIGFFVGKTYSAEGLSSSSSEPSPMQKPVENIKKSSDIPKIVEKRKESTPSVDVQPEKKELIAEEQPLKKVVYLTFDDGPSKWTEQFLEVLQEHGVKATFFMQGSNLKKEHLQEGVNRAIQEGHYIGGHSMTHDFKKLYTERKFVPEMIETLDLIHEITGQSARLVRPPYGSAPGLKDEQMRAQLANANIKVWDWTIDSKDWELAGNPSQIVRNIQEGTTSNREIILMHEKKQTLEVLPEIIQFFKAQGYEFMVYEEPNHFMLNFQNDARL